MIDRSLKVNLLLFLRINCFWGAINVHFTFYMLNISSIAEDWICTVSAKFSVTQDKNIFFNSVQLWGWPMLCSFSIRSIVLFGQRMLTNLISEKISSTTWDHIVCNFVLHNWLCANITLCLSLVCCITIGIL